MGIIGVVAALTLPTLIQNYQKKQTVTQLKKAYAELAQVIEMAEVEHGSIEHWNYIDLPQSNGSQVYYFVENYIMPYLKTSEVCFGADEIKNKCSFNLAFKAINGRNLDYSSVEARVYIITSSGYGVLLTPGGPTLENPTSAYSPHLHFYVDLNGPTKGENMMGKDVFQMSANFGRQVADGTNESAKKSGYVMFGAGWQPSLSRDDFISNNSVFGCNKENSASHSGRFCGALIQADGWEISNDYPW